MERSAEGTHQTRGAGSIVPLLPARVVEAGMFLAATPKLLGRLCLLVFLEW